jgi:hypothetical protein
MNAVPRLFGAFPLFKKGKYVACVCLFCRSHPNFHVIYMMVLPSAKTRRTQSNHRSPITLILRLAPITLADQTSMLASEADLKLF